MKNKLSVWRQKYPYESDQWRIVETYWTVDGLRSRMTSQVFPSLAAAIAYIKEGEKNNE